MPNDFAETTDGQIIIASGFDKVLAWDGFQPQARAAGVPDPPSTLQVAVTGKGAIVGSYTAFVRYLDSAGRVSNPQSVGVDFTAISGTPAAVTAASTTSPVLVTSAAHGLTDGAVVRVAGVGGQTGANGDWVVDVLDANRFYLLGSVASTFSYTGGGTWVSGVSSVVYSSIPTPTDPRVTRRQVLRNTDGEGSVYYVDIDTGDLTQSSFTSTKTDNELAAQEAVPFVDDRGQDLAYLHYPPPDHKPFVEHHAQRLFVAGEVEYTEGAVRVAFGSDTMFGVGTEWTEVIPGRFVYAVGADKAYEIATVDIDRQILTLTEQYRGTTNPYALYAIRVADAEHRLVWWSNTSEYESFSPLQAFAVPENGDRVTGLLSMGSYLLVLQRRHVYRFTFQEDPGLDGTLFLNADRGCINHRCAVDVEGVSYLLDEDGVHVIGRSNGPDGSISTPIQTLFRGDYPGFRINWVASRFFHAVHDPGSETIRWFVALSGQYLPRHCLVYHYTLERWWIEEYPDALGCSFLGRLYRQAPLATWGAGRIQPFLGTTGRRVLATNVSPLDGINPAQGQSAGMAASASLRSLTMPFAAAATESGFPVVVSAGTGVGQSRLVDSVSGSTLFLDRPWSVRPDSTSRFQLGGIPWRFKSGWFRWADEDLQNPRSLEFGYEPTSTQQSVTLRRYRNRLSDPVVSAMARKVDGLSVEAGSADFNVDLRDANGFQSVKISSGRETWSKGEKLISFGLSGVGGEELAKIYNVTVEGAQPPGEVSGPSGG